MKILYLSISEPWFSMTHKGGKTEEYRELKEYWASRLLYRIPFPSGGHFSAWKDIQSGDYECKGWAAFTGGAPVFKTFDRVEARNGYGNHRPVFQKNVESISIGYGREEWGAMPGVKYFVIKYKN